MLVSDCISQAYREADVTVIGTPPNDDQNTEALALLNSFNTRLFGAEFGENLLDWAVPPPSGQRVLPEDLVSPDLGSTWYLVPRTNSRLLLATTAATTIKFPQTPDDGSQMMFVDVGASSDALTLDGNGRLIDGQQTQVDTPQAFAGRRYFYRADLASWQQVAALTLNSSLPLASDFDDLFVTYLAIRLMPRNAQEVTEETTAIYKSLLKAATARYSQTQAIAVADPRVSEGLSSFGPIGSRDSWFT